jgi:hypothetical protein
LIEAVIFDALCEALTTLPPEALGIRSHAIPTEEHLPECVAAAELLLQSAAFSNSYVVIGSTRAAEVRATAPSLRVLPPHAAAAEATRLRNDRALMTSQGAYLVYLNSDSSPGEAGLDGLSELRAPAIARQFALGAGLPVLSAVARSGVRALLNRLDDSSVDQLATYAQTVKERGSELASLPLLGLVPRDLASHQAAASWVADFDSLMGDKLVNRLDAAIRALESIDPARRAEFEARLDSSLVPEAERPHGVQFMLRVARAARRFASGDLDQLPSLCGLSSKLLRLLRKGEALVPALLPPDPGDPLPDGRESVEPRAVLEEEFLESTSAWDSVVHVDDLEHPRSLYLQTADGERAELRSREGADLVARLAERHLDVFMNGGAIRLNGSEALVSTACPDELPTEPRALLPEPLSGPTSIITAVGSFLRARRGLLDALGRALAERSSDDEETNEQQRASQQAAANDKRLRDTLYVLEAFPLIATQLSREAAQLYVSAYENLMATSLTERAPEELRIWLTNLDTVFCAENRTVVAARLLPTHPLRIAHSLSWLTSHVRPPSFPGALAVHYRNTDWLTPHGREHSFHNVPTGVGPSVEGLRVAAQQGIRAIWTLLSPLRLNRAIEIELVDVASPAETIETLCKEIIACYEEDASVSGIHLRVVSAFSESSREAEVRAARTEDLQPIAKELLESRPGSGVSLEIVAAVRKSGAVECHLAVQAVETPYVRIPHNLALPETLGTEITYEPGSAGNIKRVLLSGNTTIESYNRLLESLNITTGMGYASIERSASVGRSLVRTLVSRQGWPIELPLDDSFLCYAQEREHLVVSLCDREILTKLLGHRLKQLSESVEGEAPLTPTQLRRGIQAMYACRAYILRLIGETDPRHLLGDLGLLRAFSAAQEAPPETKLLVISLDGPDGRAWAARIADLTDGAATRADLLIVEADSQLTQLRSLRVAELKARTSTADLDSEGNLKRLAQQAQITAARIRSANTATDPRGHQMRVEALRRLVWMGAGHQLEAHRWQDVLRDLDRALASRAALSVSAECWIVPEDEWSGETEFTRTFPSVDEAGRPQDSTETVRFRILGFQKPRSAAVVAAPPTRAPDRPRPRLVSPAASPAPSAVSVPAAASVPAVVSATPPVRAVDAATPVLPAKPIAPMGDAKPAVASAPVPKPADAARLELLLGHTLSTNTEALWRPYERSPRLSNQHVLVVGKSGSGKSETTKALIWELSRRGVPSIIFDFQGEYGKPDSDFFTAVAPQVFDAMKGLPINPFDVPLDPLTGSRRPFIESAYRLAETLNRIFRGSGDIQLGALRDAILNCYGQQGFDKERPATWNNKPPTIDMLHSTLKEMAQAGGGPVKNLLVRLQPLFESGIFQPGRAEFTLETLFNRTTVLLMTSGITNLMVAASRLMLEGIYASMLAAGESSRIRVMACVDEAHKLCGDETITTLVKEARKYGLGLILSSQETRDFHPSVFANVGTLIALQLEETDAAVMAKQIAGQDGPSMRQLKQRILGQTFPQGIVRSNHFQPYVALRLSPFHERLEMQPKAEIPEQPPSSVPSPGDAAPPVPEAEAPAVQFLNYDLLRPLKGGMAEVYEARDRTTGDRVCVKRVRRNSGEEEALDREVQIYQKIQAIESKHLLQLREFERGSDYSALIMDFADGGDLQAYVEGEPGGKLRPSKAKEIALHITEGLRLLHGAGIVHRDLKPQNILLNRDSWQLADYGIAKSLTRLMTMRTFQAAGTLGYMAPEQMDGIEAAPSADIYSLGKIFVFMLTGATDKDYVTQASWRALVSRCLDPSPDSRPSITRVIEDLTQLRV